jgi:hypothetical protein
MSINWCTNPRCGAPVTAPISTQCVRGVSAPRSTSGPRRPSSRGAGRETGEGEATLAARLVEVGSEMVTDFLGYRRSVSTRATWPKGQERVVRIKMIAP